ncbi:alpha/beta fold hydrolase [Zongyangia hominis]|uniref:Alpha/beta hydrolase n=1 Tax=Zongyangia hominis TaxID=2763677 RepID=A0A926IB86_9FIRM|nr:alpha/beta hydrolase [Zongyangia hominis]MBC8569865.1 alpha/beta hydrolase [Zongyangia hominis]
MVVQLQHIRLYYEKTGEGAPLLLLHGNGETHEIFTEAVDKLKEHFTVYALDSRCHGKSEDTGSLSYEEMTQDAADFIGALGLERPMVCGFSDGGIVGIMLALKYPGRISKLVSCGANLDPSGLRAKYRVLFRLYYLLHRDPKIKMMLTQPHIPPESLSKLHLPILVLAGEKDMIRPSHTRLIARQIPGSTLRILPGETHSSYVEHSQKIAGEILPFLKG